MAYVRRPMRLMSYILLGVFFLLLMGWTWNALIKDRIVAKRWGVVDTEMVYRSGQIHPSLVRETLVKHDIGLVIDLQYWEEKPGLLAERDAIESLKIESIRLPLNGDGRGDIEHYAQAIAAMTSATEPVLLHCAAGSQRTGGVIAMYRTLVQGRTAIQARMEMDHYGWRRDRDAVLLDYLNENKQVLAERLVELGVLDAMPEELPVF
ncbi:MAG: hypothetical protein CMP98_14360 [Gammaproteobacteria bacterium]|nr:hypothetical protein [Gammaproteobacteria bacterium]OUU06568.1 MAG: hypothetical protein CBB94_15150 [Gammaproteobacteria bacterium TMED34]